MVPTLVTVAFCVTVSDHARRRSPRPYDRPHKGGSGGVAGEVVGYLVYLQTLMWLAIGYCDAY